MEKKLKQNMSYKIFISICICIILFSFFYSLYGQALGFKEVTEYNRYGGVERVKVPEAGDAIKIPANLPQSAATYEGYDRSDWSYTNKTLYDMWVSQGKPASDSHWAYLEVGGKPRYIVALAPVYGLTGDYVDIWITNNGKSEVYPCIIGDGKDIWVDAAYTFNGVAYGHESGGKCNIIEVCSELSGASSNWSAISPLLDKLTGVTQIANGGSILEHPDGPVGLEGPYKYEDGTSSGEDLDVDDESSTFQGAINMFTRNLWDSMEVAFENGLRNRNDSSVLYDIKNLKGSNLNSSSSVSGFVQYYQTDYSDVSYGSSNIANCGCGPTSFAMVASTILKRQITPADAVSWCGNSYYVWGAGTSWDYFAAAMNHFNVPATMTTTTSIDEVAAALGSGALVISSQSEGIFTSGGHFIVLAGIDANGGITVKDPNKNNAINKGYNTRKFTKTEINQSAQNYWIFRY